MKIFIILLVFGILEVGIIQVDASSKLWDYFLFVQQWPTSFCDTEKCMESRVKPYWTIHGLWPQSLKGKEPAFCNESWPFDISKIKSLETNLTKYWPSLARESTTLFWKHEWSKHGTCACESSILTSEYDFFLAAIKMINLYPVMKYFELYGIYPNDSVEYLKEDFLNPIQKVLSVNASIACAYKNETPYLSSVRICLDKNLKVFSCPKENTYGFQEQKCDTKTKIKYPEFKKNVDAKYQRMNDLK